MADANLPVPNAAIDADTRAHLGSAAHYACTPAGKAEEALRILALWRGRRLSAPQFVAFREALRNAPAEVQERPADELARWAVDECQRKATECAPSEGGQNECASSGEDETSDTEANSSASGMGAEGEYHKSYAYDCFDVSRLDDDPAKYETWRLYSELGVGELPTYTSLSSGEQSKQFPRGCVWGRRLYKCHGCQMLFRSMWAFDQHKGPHGHPHLSGTLPAGPIPHPSELDDPHLCPSIIRTVTTKQCTQCKAVDLFVTLRQYTSEDMIYYTAADVPFLEPICYVEFERRLREEEFARMRDDLRDARRERDVARSASTKAQKEVWLC